MIFADADIAWIEVVSQLTASASFACLVWYFIIKHLPTLAKQHEEERNRWLVYMEKRDERFQAIVDGLVKRVDTCIERTMSDRKRNND